MREELTVYFTGGLVTCQTCGKILTLGIAEVDDARERLAGLKDQ
jgi:hypothetical protein